MELTKSEKEFTHKQINKLEKFEKQWPYLRWAIIVFLIGMLCAGLGGLFSVEKIKTINEINFLLEGEAAPSDINDYFDDRVRFLRNEIRLYIGFMIYIVFIAILFGITVFCWDIHRYIKLKNHMLKQFLEQKELQTHTIKLDPAAKDMRL